jgi:hypothetical protein
MTRTAIALIALLLGVSGAAAQSTNTATFNQGVPTPITITTGNTFQTILAAIPIGSTVPRRSLTIQNNNATDNCWIFIGALTTPTKAQSILLQPGIPYQRYYPYVPSDAIQGTCATTADSIYVDTQ